MEVQEFKKSVEDYLNYINPLLKEKELETIVNQIIREAGQRLVLIESPQEGKVGFGLTTTREFFAAAHLVDNAKNTKQRDQRFKSILKYPHWRNVVLFFAGRVGRTRPGEAPSMIDVCREIDTEPIDKFLKTGAELVMEMVDDRVLREPHNEIGAIQYGLTVLNKEYLKDEDKLVNRLKNLPKEYIERVIRPWFEEQMSIVYPENIMQLTNFYQKLFGANEFVIKTIKKVSEFDSVELRLWALSQSFKNKIVESWVLELFNELSEIIVDGKIENAIMPHNNNFKFYLKLPLNRKAKLILCRALLSISPYEMEEDYLDKSLIDLLEINSQDLNKENQILLWAVSQFILYRAFLSRINSRMNFAVIVNLPLIVNPELRESVLKNSDIIKEFCNLYNDEEEPFVRLLVSLYNYLIDPVQLCQISQCIKSP